MLSIVHLLQGAETKGEKRRVCAQTRRNGVPAKKRGRNPPPPSGPPGGPDRQAI